MKFKIQKNILRGKVGKVIITKSDKRLKRVYKNQLYKETNRYIGFVTAPYKFKDAIILRQ